MTRLQLRTTVRSILQENTTGYWTDAILNQWMEDGQLDIVWKTNCKRTRGLFTTVASTRRYTLTTLFTDFLKILKGGISIYDSTNDRWILLEQYTKERLETEYPSWQTEDAGEPILYEYDAEVGELVIYPMCDTQYVEEDYGECYYVSKPTAMTGDGSSPDIPVVLHRCLVNYVVATGLESRGYQDIANTQWAQYAGKLSDYTSERKIEEDGEIMQRSTSWE